MCFCFVDRMSVSFCCFEIVIVIITVGSISMDRFVKKSAVKSLKRQNSGKEYDKEYDGKKRKRNFQSSWLAEFPWLTLDKDRGIMKCKICCKWPNVCDPKSPLVTGSDRFRKDPLYTHAKSSHHTACVVRTDNSKKPIKDTPIGKAVVRSQKEQQHKLKGLFNTAYAIAKNCRPFR